MPRPALIPTIHELRTFETVARLGSISRAAEELGCSQPAVTYKLKALEQRWSVPLFERTTRVLTWTEKAHAIYARVQRILGDVDDLAAQFDEADRRELTISVSPALASTWLVKRLSSYRQRHPQIDLRLSATNRFVDLSRERVDGAIRLLPSSLAVADSLAALPLVSDHLIVVAAPGFPAIHEGRIDFPALDDRQLIWQESTDHWQRFFAHHVGRPVRYSNGPRFNNSDLVIQAAMQGQGVAIVRELIAADAVGRGELVRIGAYRLACEDRYHLVYDRRTRRAAELSALAGWLLDEMAQAIGTPASMPAPAT